MKRVLLTMGSSVLIATVLAVFIGMTASFWIGILLLLVSGGLFALRKKQSAAFAYARCITACSAAALLLFCLQTVRFVQPLEQFCGSEIAFEGIVQEVRELESKNRYVVKGRFPVSDEPQRTVQIEVSELEPLEVYAGDMIKCNVKLFSPSEGVSNPFVRDPMLLSGYISGRDPVVEPSEEFSLGALLGKYRTALKTGLQRAVKGVQGEVLVSMLFGGTGNLPGEIAESFRVTGIAHILAVSGLHLSILMQLVLRLLSFLKLSRKTRLLGAMGSVLAFMALAGFIPSILRAGVMSLTYLAAQLLSREKDSLNSLGLSALVILLINPYNAVDAGFLLSFFATLGMILFQRPLTGFLFVHVFRQSSSQANAGNRLHVILDMFTVSLAAMILTLPLMAGFFGRVSLLSPVVNLLITPLLPIAIGLLTALFGVIPLLAPLATLFGVIAAGAVTVVLGVAQAWEAIPFASLQTDEAYVVIWLAVTVAAGSALFLLRAPAAMKRLGVCLSATVLLALSLFQAVAANGTLKLMQPEGCEAMVLVSGKQAVVIGVPSKADHAREISTFLLRNGIKTIELAVLPEKSMKYTRGYQALCDAVPPKQVVTMEDTYGSLNITAFSQVRMTAQTGENAPVCIDIGDIRLVKLFEKKEPPYAQQADVLIGKKGELSVNASTENRCELSSYGNYGAQVARLRC